MDSVAMVLTAAIGVLSLVSAATRGVAAPIFLWNVAHVVGLTLPFSLYYFGVQVSAHGFVDLHRENGEEIARLAVLCSAAVLVTNAFVYWMPSYSRGQHLAPRRVEHHPAPRETMVAVLVWFACMGIGALLVSRTLGSFTEGFALLSTKVYTPLAGQTYILLPFTLAQLVVIALGVEIATEPRVGVRKMLIVGALIVITMMVMLGVGSRSKALQTILIPALVFMARQPLGSKVVLGAVAPLLIFAVSWVGLELRSSDPNRSAREFNVIDAASGFSSSYAILDQLWIVQRYVEAYGSQSSKYILDYASIFVPRSLWLEKPFSPHLELRWFLYGDTQGGITPGYYGEFYYYFGNIGFLFGAIIAGLILVMLGRRVARSIRERRPDVLVFFWSFIVGLEAPRDSMFVVAFHLIVGAIFLKVFQSTRSVVSRSLQFNPLSNTRAPIGQVFGEHQL